MSGRWKNYQYALDPADRSAAAKVVRLTGKGRRVLELGCAAGSMTRVLSERNHCQVTAIEADAQAADEARPFLSRLIIADLDTFDWSSLSAEPPFDVVLAADVLEHLLDPLACLRAIRALLGSAEAALIVSLPNIAHLAVVSGLLRGEFRYTDTGLLDRTHLRFYTPRGAARLLAEAGFEAMRVELTHLGAKTREGIEYWRELGLFSRMLLRSRPELRIYQTIWYCRPAPAVSGEQNIARLEQAIANWS